MYTRTVQWVVILFLIMSSSSVQAAAPDPTEQLKPFIDKITGMLADAQADQDLQCSLCQRVIDVARERFDFKEMSKRVMGRSWRDLSVAQQDDFTLLFTQLLQYAYIKKVKDYSSDSTVEYKRQRIRGTRAEVQTVLIDSGRTIPVSYIMLLEGDQWMVYDVVVEGVSLVRNYMEQFSQIINEQGYEGLVKQVEDKIVELEQEEQAAATGSEPPSS